jgi:hypothetical protein
MSSVVIKDSYKADVFNFDVEQNGDMSTLTINNVISWQWIQMKLTKDEIRGLANFLNQFVEDNP